MGRTALVGSTPTDLDRTTRASIIVPWRPGCEHRQRVWDWLKSRYAYPIIEGTEDGVGHWIKANAVTPAVRSADTDVVAIVDADVWCDELDAAIDHVAEHGGWAVPHLTIHRLTEDATTAVIAGADPRGQPLEDNPYDGVVGGGAIVLERDLYLAVPLDPRFIAWGGEDHSWGYALKTLAGIPGMRGQGPLWHFWHPPEPRRSRRHSLFNDKLWGQYLRASGNVERTLELISAIGGTDAPLPDHPR